MFTWLLSAFREACYKNFETMQNLIRNVDDHSKFSITKNENHNIK